MSNKNNNNKNNKNYNGIVNKEQVKMNKTNSHFRILKVKNINQWKI